MPKFNLMFVLIVAVVTLSVAFAVALGRIHTLHTTIATLNNNITVMGEHTKFRIDKQGKTIAERNALELTSEQLRNSSDSTIQVLNKNIANQGVKIKNLEYAISVKTGMRIDTTVITRIDSVDRLHIQYIDTLNIGDFHLRRSQEVGHMESKYAITYTPTLYITIERYKEGSWRIRNLFHRRPIRYKTTINSSDKLLAPKEILIVKAI